MLLSVEQQRTLLRLLEEALESGLFKNPNFVEREGIRVRDLDPEDRQTQYNAICAVEGNLRSWLQAREETASLVAGRNSKYVRSCCSILRSRLRNRKTAPAADNYNAPHNHDRRSMAARPSYLRGREQLREKINELYESGLELLNETGSILFIFTTLRHDASTGNKLEESEAFLSLSVLYILAVITFTLSLLVRLLIALSAYPEVDPGYIYKSDLSTGYIRVKRPNPDGRADQRRKFFAFVFLYLIEPNSGKKCIASTFRQAKEFFNADGTSHEMHPLALEFHLLHSESETNIRTILAVILLADLPELCIELLYLLLLL
ncbi:unnamed protein product [Amoebophrya sp. A25]|nr:unnamed protein product [Amoebophrya sp. A25]|eukprot:GSA25T00022223001.1